MAPTIQVNTQEGVTYTPTSDAHDRHEFGVSKNRKLASTGGGRAWSEDEVSPITYETQPSRGCFGLRKSIQGAIFGKQ